MKLRLFASLVGLAAGGAIAEPVQTDNVIQIQISNLTPARYQSQPGRNRCQGADGYSSAPGGYRTFLWRPEWLALEKQRVATDPAYAKLLVKAAEAALRRGPYSVVDKTKLPASGDRHDYYSIGPYWWPTEGKPNGEPYMRRDGEVNPESRGNEFDKDRMIKFSGDVRVLALAYHHLGDRRYADHAAKLLRTWFTSTETRMNPNLNNGQAVPGVNSGRGEGIIELNVLAGVVESIGLIEPAGVLTDSETMLLKKWFADLTGWMANSPIGQEERTKQNNHGIHYDYMITHFALFAGIEPIAKQVATDFLTRRLVLQMKADGSLPEELARTRSWHYSFFALEAATKLATVAECVGLDIWSSKTSDGRGLATAFAFLAPYQANMRAWPYKDTGLVDPSKLDSVKRVAMEPLRMMAWGTGDIRYERLATNHDVAINAAENYWLPPLVDMKAQQ
jgi:hypothetical protein